jgi:N-acetylneuraminate synthase
MVEVATAAGADAVKFQCFIPELLVTRTTPQAAYQRRNLQKDGQDESKIGDTASQLQMLRELTLSEEQHRDLAVYCSQLGIDYLSSPFDLPSLRFLCRDINLLRIKFGSGEITNGPLLLEAAENDKQVILSTGMSNLEEIQWALSVLAFGYVGDRTELPSLPAFEKAYKSQAGRQALTERVVLLHCTSAYPCPYEEINLRAMDTLSREFQLPVGLSDHSQGIEVPTAAVARGATIVEKHFTLDRNLPGPDHKASLEPGELKQMVRSIRHIEKALGDAVKRTTHSEQDTKSVARKHLVAATHIKSGQLFTEENLTAKRTASGLSPMRYWDFLGQKSQRDYEPDQIIEG